MKSPGRLIATVAAATGKNRHTVEKIYDGLRAAGEVPTGPRGRYGMRVTSEIGAKVLLAVCGSEHVRDAAFTVRRYASLTPNNSTRFIADGEQFRTIIVPDSWWDVVQIEFPRLAELPRRHLFIDAITALIDSYVGSIPRADVSVSLRAPDPGARVSIILERRDTPEWRVEIDYQDEQSVDGLDSGLAEMDADMQRRRRRVVDVKRDLKIQTTISHVTLRAVGELLREAPAA